MPLDHDPPERRANQNHRDVDRSGAVLAGSASVKVEKHWAYLKPCGRSCRMKDEKWAAKWNLIILCWHGWRRRAESIGGGG